jgi:hypothetical protein
MQKYKMLGTKMTLQAHAPEASTQEQETASTKTKTNKQRQSHESLLALL